MFSHIQDSLSEGVIYPGRAVAAFSALMVLAVLLSSL